MQKLFGKNAGLSPSELRTPMGELRPMLLARAEQASNQLMQQVEAQAAIKPDQRLKETIRIAISAVAYAIGFAFLAGVLPRGKAPFGSTRQARWLRTISSNWRSRRSVWRSRRSVAVVRAGNVARLLLVSRRSSFRG